MDISVALKVAIAPYSLNVAEIRDKWAPVLTRWAEILGSEVGRPVQMTACPCTGWDQPAGLLGPEADLAIYGVGAHLLAHGSALEVATLVMKRGQETSFARILVTGPEKREPTPDEQGDVGLYLAGAGTTSGLIVPLEFLIANDFMPGRFKKIEIVPSFPECLDRARRIANQPGGPIRYAFVSDFTHRFPGVSDRPQEGFVEVASVPYPRDILAVHTSVLAEHSVEFYEQLCITSMKVEPELFPGDFFGFGNRSNGVAKIEKAYTGLLSDPTKLPMSLFYELARLVPRRNLSSAHLPREVKERIHEILAARAECDDDDRRILDILMRWDTERVRLADKGRESDVIPLIKSHGIDKGIGVVADFALAFLKNLAHIA